MHCILVALVITCSGPSIKTTAAEAIAILGPPPAILLAPARPDWRPSAIVTIAETRTDGPFGAFPPERPFVRLDGSSYVDPPWLHVGYSNYPWRGSGQRGGVGHRSGRRVVK